MSINITIKSIDNKSNTLTINDPKNERLIQYIDRIKELLSFDPLNRIKIIFSGRVIDQNDQNKTFEEIGINNNNFIIVLIDRSVKVNTESSSVQPNVQSNAQSDSSPESSNVENALTEQVEEEDVYSIDEFHAILPALFLYLHTDPVLSQIANQDPLQLINVIAQPVFRDVLVSLLEQTNQLIPQIDQQNIQNLVEINNSNVNLDRNGDLNDDSHDDLNNDSHDDLNNDLNDDPNDEEKINEMSTLIPTVPKDIIRQVFINNGRDMDLTMSILLDMSDEFNQN